MREGQAGGQAHGPGLPATNESPQRRRPPHLLQARAARALVAVKVLEGLELAALRHTGWLDIMDIKQGTRWESGKREGWGTSAGGGVASKGPPPTSDGGGGGRRAACKASTAAPPTVGARSGASFAPLACLLAEAVRAPVLGHNLGLEVELANLVPAARKATHLVDAHSTQQIVERSFNTCKWEVCAARTRRASNRGGQPCQSRTCRRCLAAATPARCAAQQPLAPAPDATHTWSGSPSGCPPRCCSRPPARREGEGVEEGGGGTARRRGGGRGSQDSQALHYPTTLGLQRAPGSALRPRVWWQTRSKQRGHCRWNAGRKHRRAS